jgi:hypothetical protein
MIRVEPGVGARHDFIELFRLMEEIQEELRPQDNRNVLKSVIEILKNISMASIESHRWTADPRELLYQLHGRLKQEELQNWESRIQDLVKENSRRECVA